LTRQARALCGWAIRKYVKLPGKAEFELAEAKEQALVKAKIKQLLRKQWRSR
jgi:hypothetical protein